MELLVPIIAALIGGSLAAFVSAWFSRKKTKAETQATVADTAMRIMQQTLENTVDPLNKRVDKLEAENQEQAIALENLNGQYLKLQLAYTIISGQLKQLGHIPAIALEDLDNYTIDQLRDMARSMSNVVKRRQTINDKSD